jgi:hypothetical protein
LPAGSRNSHAEPQLYGQWKDCGQLWLESERNLSSARFVRLFAILFLCVLVCACRTAAPTISFSAAKSAAPLRAVVENVRLSEVRASDGTDYLAIKIQLRRADGTTVTIATDQATLSQAAFGQHLVKGRVYDWPKAITDFQQEIKQTQRSNYRKPSWDSPSTTN